MVASFDEFDVDGPRIPRHLGPEGVLRATAETGDPVAMRQYGGKLVAEGKFIDGARFLASAAKSGEPEAEERLPEIVSRLRAEALSDNGEDAEEAARLLRWLGEDADAPKPMQEPEPEPLALAARMVSDLPSDRDVLGFAPLVEGLRALLNARRTKLPLAIAVTAPWGMGKSSVMLQLEELLLHPDGREPQERKWWTVKFPAWKYERSERLWAALAKEIYEQPQRQMGARERIRFRIRVERRRLGWRRFLLKGLWPPIAAVAAVLVALAAGADLGASVRLPVALTTIAAVAATLSHYWGLASMPFKRAMERYVSKPDYDSQLGFTTEADRDITSLAEVLAPDTEEDPRALAVFVDDLDRCTSAHVVEAVEAMNQIFNARERRGCVFVLGLDREVVATSIEVAYGATVERLGEQGRSVGTDFGMHFLAKLVQLVVTVPEPSADAVTALLGDITGNPVPEAHAAVDEEDVKRVEEEIREQQPDSLAAISAAAPEIDVSEAAREVGRRRVLAERIQDSPDVAGAEFELLGRLGRNPRQIKRFDNAFRLQLYVANQEDDCELDFSPDQLVALGKWVALRLRWPRLADVLDAEPAMIGVLEGRANGEGAPASVTDLEISRLKDRHERWFEDREVRSFLHEPDGDARRRVASLTPRSFLRVS